MVQQLKDKLWELPDNKLKKLIKAASRVRREKYRKLESREPIYGDIERGFTDEEAELFFSGFEPDEQSYRILFFIQRFTGRRIGEICRLNLADLDFEKKYIKFKRNKTKAGKLRVDFVRIVEPLFFPLLDYVETYRRALERREGFLFFSRFSSNKSNHIEPNYARLVFRKVCERTGLNDVYAELKNNRVPTTGKPRRLFRLTPHSFRHGLISSACWKQEIPVQLVAKMVGHDSVNTTMKYAQNPPKKYVDRAMESLWKPSKKP